MRAPATLKVPTMRQTCAERDMDQTQVLPLLLVSLLFEHIEACWASGPLHWLVSLPDAPFPRIPEGKECPV